ncbi:MAG: lipid-A-disaccharide synthase [Sphingomonadales bacterium]|nr:lipid-A-disaccharide synthase [Sphingomonadales bacterium]
MRYYLIAGEASGDLHGSHLIAALHQQDPQAVIRCWGGDKMQAAGATLVKHYRDLAFMGFAEVIKNLPTILRNIRACKKDIEQFCPDVVVCIDYPGFNLRIAKWAHAQKMRVVYYIAPQVWAWKEDRVKGMKQYIDQLLVILPFEKDFFATRWQWPVSYVGHPLVQVVDLAKQQAPDPLLTDKPLVALLPGSRQQEIAKKLPIMLQVSSFFPDHQFIVAKAPGTPDEFYTRWLAAFPTVQLVSDRTYSLLRQAKAALVTSGTATLETALFGVPQVVCYKGSWLSYQIGKRLIKVKYISLVNLIMNKPVVTELIQDQLTVNNLQRALQELLSNSTKRQQIQEDYAQLQALLRSTGQASSTAATLIISGITRSV